MPRPVFHVANEFEFNANFVPLMQGRFCKGIMCLSKTMDEYQFVLMARSEDGRIVAAAKLLAAPGLLSLRYIETAHDAKRNGYGRRLFTQLFRHAAQSGVGVLEITDYTRLGAKYLMPHEERLARVVYPWVMTEGISPPFL
ncbi:MAG: hypothetical protein H6865_08500 [Rhodospirillales bacterium]|nr:hypothetical protein [Alphaproteobacteria bacterium]MCB9987655.1 hypothetical protein [Rhodospirillales bacterium]USO08046.1 MAG: hypothetical protein H6866_02175 [Rhodospirillales bacterium]